MGPRFSSTYVLVDEDASGKKWSDAAVYSVGVGASGTYYGTFRTNVGRLRGIRHVLFPTISYNFSPRFDNLFFTDSNGTLRQRFPSTAGISIASNEQSFLAYGVQNRFQIRFRRGDQDVTFPNFITWNTNGTYDFRWRERGLTTPWGPVTNRINIQPPSFFSLDATSLHRFDAKPYFRSFNMNAGVRLSGGAGRPGPIADIPLDGNEALSRPDFLTGGPWNASVSYSFAAGRNAEGGWDVQQSANSLLSFSPTRNWHLDYYNTLNLTEGEITAQEFAVVRDLHCWQARFVRRFTASGESEFFFRISIRDRPDVYLEQGTRGLGSFVNF